MRVLIDLGLLVDAPRPWQLRAASDTVRAVGSAAEVLVTAMASAAVSRTLREALHPSLAAGAVRCVEPRPGLPASVQLRPLLTALRRDALEPNLVIWISNQPAPRLPDGVDLVAVDAERDPTEAVGSVLADAEASDDISEPGRCSTSSDELAPPLRPDAWFPEQRPGSERGVARRPMCRREERLTIERAATVLADATPGEIDLAADAIAHAGLYGLETGPPRLLVDVTEAMRLGRASGIQRVVLRLAATLPALTERQVVLVHTKDGMLRVALPSQEAEAIPRPATDPVSPRTGDVLLLPDSNWLSNDLLEAWSEKLRSAGGAVYAVIHDIIPLTHEELTTEAVRTAFRQWFHHALRCYDGLICTTRAGGRTLQGYIANHDLSFRDGLQIGVARLGSDSLAPAGGARPALSSWFERTEPVLVMLGTVEPRKRHEVALDALERLWRDGGRMRLLILGGKGWVSPQLVERLERLALTDRLMWVTDASDSEVAFALSKSHALLFPSVAEGFGLPLVEAARAGLPVIASDVPVLREVGGEGASYFEVDDPIDLVANIEALLDETMRPDPARTPIFSWSDCAEAVLDVIYGHKLLSSLRVELT